MEQKKRETKKLVKVAFLVQVSMATTYTLEFISMQAASLLRRQCTTLNLTKNQFITKKVKIYLDDFNKLSINK